jgi:ABC-2 type transport system ATP-binding protein
MSVKVEALTKVFRSRQRAAVTAVQDVSFTIAEQETVGLLGANGAGKTTTIKCMSGLVRPTSGTVELDGLSVWGEPRKAASKVSVVLEGNRNLYWRMTARENIDFFAGLQGIKRRSGIAFRDELLERMGLTEKARTPARMLSRGMQQKLALACALARKTPVLLLDEPTLGLDVEISLELRSYLRNLAREGHSILISSHDMNVVQAVCDRVVVLVDGRIVADETVSNLLGLFRAQAYSFVLRPDISMHQTERLQKRFPLLSIRKEASDTVVEVEFADETGLYDIVDIFRSDGTVVRSIDRKEPNLEEIFINLIKKARER